MSLLRYLAIASLIASLSAPAAGRDPAYLTSQACAECHQDAYDAWSDSHHGWAWRPATPENVLGDFSDAAFEHDGVKSRFFHREERYYVETDGPDGKRTTYELTWTVGVEPLQQYLAKLDDGRLQALDIAWDVEGKRWYHLYPDQELAGDPALHWTGPYKNWNARCVSCHVTGFAKGYDPQTNRYESSWSEPGVGCEACHGPGETHVDWARQEAKAPEAHRETASYSGTSKVGASKLGAAAMGLVVNLSAGDSQGKLEVCAGCHSRRESLGADSPPPGEPFDDHYRIALLREGLYHADGQIEDEVYVYGSFLQSKMHARGVSCDDCHQPHSAELIAEGDAVCTQCHNPEGNPEFPTLLPASYESPLHHRHPAGSEATRCVSCHMPTKNYMVVDPRRDHSFRVPRPDLSVELGVPNVCSDCHAGRSDVWARDQVREWFPEGRHLRPHYGQVLHAGREGLNEASVTALIELALDDAEPAIARASALELLAPVASPQIVAQFLPLLEDVSPWVRSAVLNLFESAPQAARAKHSGPLLDDPVRSVRIAAARQIIDIPTGPLNPSDRAIAEGAIEEYQASLSAHTDFPEVQMNLARLAQRVGQGGATARHSYEAALALDPKLSEAWLALAQIEADAGRFGAAKKILDQAITEVPDAGVLHQLLGRTLVQLGDQDAALKAFRAASRALPNELEVRIEYVSLLSNIGQFQQALEVLAQAGDATRHDPEVLYLQAYNHAQLNQMQEAHRAARELKSRHPEHALNQHIEPFLIKN